MNLPRRNRNSGNKRRITPLKLPTAKPKLLVVDAPVQVKAKKPQPIKRHGGYSIDNISPGRLAAWGEYREGF